MVTNFPEDAVIEASSIAVVADDFTSAMDAAAPFARLGHAACILGRCGAVDRRAAVWALDCDSRRQAPEEAERRTADAVARLRGAGTLVKTVDSTLRGHIGPEIAAAWRAARRRLTVIAPAFPAAGRVTRGGRQYAHGVAIHESAFARDTRHPARSSDLRELLDAAGVPDVVLRDAGKTLPDEGVVVVDAEDEADLRAVVRGVDGRVDVLWVGSPGLSRALAEATPPAPRPWSVGVVARRLLVVAGTHHQATRQQVETLVQALGDRAVVLGDGDLDPSSQVDVAILLAPRRPRPEPVDDASAHAVADRLARRAAELIRRTGIDGCIATGGETADAVVRTLDGESIEVLGEPEPGVGLGLVHGQARCLLATKAGGFGDAGTLLRVYHAMSVSGRLADG